VNGDNSILVVNERMGEREEILMGAMEWMDYILDDEANAKLMNGPNSDGWKGGMMT
jgi:hypothetical protein